MNFNYKGQDVYATSDLVIVHPTASLEEGPVVRIHGRADDQIMLSSGEKVLCFDLHRPTAIILTIGVFDDRRTQLRLVRLHFPQRVLSN